MKSMTQLLMTIGNPDLAMFGTENSARVKIRVRVLDEQPWKEVCIQRSTNL
jgi:hypothetical protein